MAKKNSISAKKHPSEDVGSALAELEAIFGNLKDLLAKVYERGGSNAKEHILSLASQSGQFEVSRSHDSAEGLKRAPRGAARKLVERALVEGPKTIREIRDAANSNVEKFLSYQTVRLELERGKVQKRYKKSKGKWSLV